MNDNLDNTRMARAQGAVGAATDAGPAGSETPPPHPAARTRQPDNSRSVQVRRLRTEQDIQATWPLSLALHRESRYARLRLCQSKRDAYLRDNMLAKPDRFALLVAEWGGRPVGYLACAANRFLYGDDIIASCLSFYVLPAYRSTLLGGRIAVKLLDAYRRWALNRRAVEIQFHVTSGFNIAATDRFLRRAGLRQTGGNYSLALAGPGGRGEEVNGGGG